MIPIGIAINMMTIMTTMMMKTLVLSFGLVLGSTTAYGLDQKLNITTGLEIIIIIITIIMVTVAMVDTEEMEAVIVTMAGVVTEAEVEVANVEAVVVIVKQKLNKKTKPN